MGVERKASGRAADTETFRVDATVQGGRMARRAEALRSRTGRKAPDSGIRFLAESPWYELFSRGARDWLRHNQKVRQAVRAQLVDLLAESDLITQPDARVVRVPVKLLEHARFRLADSEK